MTNSTIPGAFKPDIQPSWIYYGALGDDVNASNLVDCLNHLFNNMISIFVVLQEIDRESGSTSRAIPQLGFMLEGMAKEGQELINQWSDARPRDKRGQGDAS